MRHVTESRSLHVFVSDFSHQFGPHGFPRKILALAPSALATGHATLTVTGCLSMLGPGLPRVSGQRVMAIRREEFRELQALLLREARADTHVLQRA